MIMIVLTTLLLVQQAMGQTSTDPLLTIVKSPNSNKNIVVGWNETEVGTLIVCSTPTLYTIDIKVYINGPPMENASSSSLSPENNGYSIYIRNETDQKECHVVIIQVKNSENFTFNRLRVTPNIIHKPTIQHIAGDYNFTFVAPTGDESSSDMDMSGSGPGTGCSGTDIPGTDIPGPDIQGPDIQGTDIPRTDIPSTDIQGTDIQGTDIPSTDIQGTDIQGTDIPGTDIQGTDIPSTDIPGTDGFSIPNANGFSIPDANGSGRSSGSYALILMGLCLVVLQSSSLH